MLPGFRYHLVTVIAIFLALGVGMIIGGAFVQGPLVARLTSQVDGLRNRFDNEIAPLREDNQRYQAYLDRLRSSVVRGRLRDHRVAIVVTGDFGDALPGVREILTDAGADVANVTTIAEDFVAKATESAEKLRELAAAKFPNLPKDTSAPFHLLSHILARGDTDNLLAKLSEFGLLTHEGDYASSVTLVVALGGAAESSRRQPLLIDQRLCAELKTAGLRVAGAEPEDAAVSYVSAWSEAGASTVDNVNTLMGRIALVMALDPKQERGDFGAKPTARGGLLPPEIP